MRKLSENIVGICLKKFFKKKVEKVCRFLAENAVEELKRPHSHPTAEMVEAIKDALNHFEII